MSNKADKYLKETITEILEEGQWDKEPRTRWADNTPAHSKFVTQKVYQYDISKGEFPINTLRTTALKEYGEMCEDFNSLDSNLISWCSDKIYEDDLGYISFNFILARIKELKSKKIDTLTKNGQYEFNINSSIIIELENLLE